MDWTKEKLEEFLKDKDRSVDVDEYLLLIDFINRIKPSTLIDIGSYLGASGYILGTCCDSIKYLFSIENIDTPDYYPKPEAEKEDHGKYLPDNAIFLTKGYENGVFQKLIHEHKDAFVFWDAGKNTNKVLRQLELSYNNNVKYIALHDSGKIQRTVRRALLRAEYLNWYDVIEENITSCPSKGVTILERLDGESKRILKDL